VSPRTRSPLTTLTLFQAKLGRSGVDELLKSPSSYDRFSVRNREGFLGVLLVKPPRPRRPRWLEFFDGHLDEVPDDRRFATSSLSAVLVIDRGGRTYALTFGYGRSMLLDGVVEESFGLRTALNILDSERVRSLDRKSFEQVQRSTREQVSRESSFGAFGIDVEQDLLSAVTGTPRDLESYGRQISGRDALKFSAEVDVDSLPGFIDRFGSASEEEGYRERYPWIDNMKEVDTTVAAELEAKLVAELRADRRDRIWLAPPHILDWERVTHFTYRSAQSAERFAYLSFDDYFSDVRTPGDLSSRHLTNDRVRCHQSDDTIVDSWTLGRCLCAELTHDGARHVLSEGKWYRLNDDFVARVLAAVDQIGPTDYKFPQYNDVDEGAYNERVHRKSKGRLALMDKKMIPAPVANGSVEFCDLFHRDGRMMHVKRYGGSSALSHLFAQGVVSARQFQLDRLFRSQVNDKLPASHRLSDAAHPISAEDYEVAYVVVAKKGAINRLPFFSMVNLKGVSELLSQIGFRVSLTFVSRASR